MSTSETKYFIEGWKDIPLYLQYHMPALSEEFKPEDVQPYYDIYDDGRLILYINLVRTKRYRIFWKKKEEIIHKINDDRIRVLVTEKPERRECGKE